MRKDQRLKHLAMLHDSLAELRKTRIDCMEEGASDATLDEIDDMLVQTLECIARVPAEEECDG
jgi:hypothetical protein